jgi:hypothetical protein
MIASTIIQRPNDDPEWVNEIQGVSHFSGELLRIGGNWTETIGTAITPVWPVIGGDLAILGMTERMVGRNLEWLGEEEYAEPYEYDGIENANENVDMVGINYDCDVSKEAKKSRDSRERMEGTYWGQYAERLW